MFLNNLFHTENTEHMFCKFEKVKTRLSMTARTRGRFFLDTFHRDTYRRLKKLLQSHDLILDVGSLNSPYTVYFSNTVVAIDLPQNGRFGYSEEVLKDLRLRRNLNTVIGNGDALPFKEEIFDKIICTEVLEHIYNDKYAVSEIARVLKLDGKVFITTPNKDEIPLECGIEEHIRHYTQKELHALLSQFFESVVIEKRFRFWLLPSAGYAFLARWHKNLFHIHLLLASLFSLSLYNLIYFFEKLLQSSNNKGSNLVSDCSNPVST